MKSSDTPKKHSVPFGQNGNRNDIPETTTQGSGLASLREGFPPLTMTPKVAGGIPPSGKDFNGILNELSAQCRWNSTGAGYPFDQSFCDGIGGYPVGAKIPQSDLSGLWLNTKEDNTTDPEAENSSLTGWVPVETYGVTTISGLAASSVTLTSLQAAKDRIKLTGTLTSNINVVLPAWTKHWTVINGCTGKFSVTVKTLSGSGVVIPAGLTANVFGDGINIIQELYLLGSPGRQINMRVITSSGAYYPTEGVKKIIVECVGGGGAGGRCVATASGYHNVSGGGGAGGTAMAIIKDPLKEYSVIIGAGGQGAASPSGASASGGGETSFGVACLAGGGAGGGNGNSASIPSNEAVIASGGSAGRGVTGNLFLGSYESASPSIGVRTGRIASGGGSTKYGSGGEKVGTGTEDSISGGDGVGFGAGGGGAISFGANKSASGGSGANGLVIVWEYS